MGFMPDQSDRPESGTHERKEVLSIFRELWSMGNSPLHRMYSSWEELERNIDIKSDEASSLENNKIRSCPYCGARQTVTRPLDGIFPYSNCESCKRPFYIQSNFSVRKLTEEEKTETPEAWIRIIEDLSKKKAAVILKLE
jgi:hypothetical protein